MRWRWLMIVVVSVAIAGWWLARPAARPSVAGQMSVAEAVNGDPSGFARVTTQRPFQFPADHGPHPDFQTEWWYYTGNLEGPAGRHWGYQLTFFRRGLTSTPTPRQSDWQTSAVYLAHFALTDVRSGQFYASDQYSRNGAALAGAQADPYRVWLDNWSATGSGNRMHLAATHAQIALDLDLDNLKPPVLQGDRGVSQKSTEPGNASYYYSLTRLASTGTVRVNEQSFAVKGFSWMDHEWSTSSLGANTVGWDWFGLHLTGGRELMYFQLRRRDGAVEPVSSGTIVGEDGQTTQIGPNDLTLDVLDHWRSPHSGATYPAGWHLRLPQAGLDLTIKPYLANQELPLNIVYWEGASHITGTADGQPVTGDGYVELTGYGDQRPSQGR